MIAYAILYILALTQRHDLYIHEYLLLIKQCFTTILQCLYMYVSGKKDTNARKVLHELSILFKQKLPNYTFM